MENKYYIPTLSDFMFGLEYECQVDKKDNWQKFQFGSEFNDILKKDEHWTIAFKELIEAKVIRVKHLDREDVEELGWEYDEFNMFSFGKNRGYWVLEILDNKNIHIYNHETEICFQGTILNKSRLKLVMEMLNINQKES